MNRVKSFSRKLLWFVLALSFAIEAAALFNAHADAQTQPTPSDDQVNAIASQLLCPVCANIPLDVCQSTACNEWRDLIREKLAQGWTEKQIKQYFVTQYGERVLVVPPPQGLNWLIYLIPIAIVIGAAYFSLHFFRRSPRQVELDLPEATSVDSEKFKEKLERDLKEEK